MLCSGVRPRRQEALGTMHREMGELLETISADVDVPFGEFRQVTRTAASAFLQTPTAQMVRHAHRNLLTQHAHHNHTR